MSQKFAIDVIKVTGSVYLGLRDEVDTWSSNPKEIMEWLSDGWRYRFNQRRAERIKPDAEKAGLDSAARQQKSFLSALPSMILQSPEKIEKEEWFSALKRIKTTKNGGIPKFKSYRRDGQNFVCWHNNGANARYRRLSKNRSEVIITGKNPSGMYGAAQKLNWEISIRFRGRQAVRDYTSLRVNWSAGTLVFVNAPLPITRRNTGSIVGIDMGVVHTISDSNGGFFDITKPEKKQALAKKELQSSIARKDITNKKLGGKEAMFGSKRRQKAVSELARLSATEARRRKDWVEKTTTKLVQAHDFMAIEDLKTSAMTRKGGARKRALNGNILQNNWGMFRARLETKADLAGSVVTAVNPAYTSQQCSKCEHIAKENRESQAIFKCMRCGYSANADTNAAVNILNRGLEQNGLGHSLERGAKIRPIATSVAGGASVEALTSVDERELVLAGIPRL